MTALPAAGDAEPAAGLCRRAVALAARRNGVAAQSILTGDRRRDVVWARHVAMWLARRAGLSLPAIGRALGCDHTTVLNGVRRVDRTAAADPAARAELHQLAAALPRVDDRAAATVCALPAPAVVAAMRVLTPVIGDPRRRRLLAEQLVDAVAETCAAEGRRRAEAAIVHARRRLAAAAAQLADEEA